MNRDVLNEIKSLGSINLGNFLMKNDCIFSQRKTLFHTVNYIASVVDIRNTCISVERMRNESNSVKSE